MKIIKSIIPYIFWIAIFIIVNVTIICASFSLTDTSLYNLIKKHNGYKTLTYYIDVNENEVLNISNDLQNYIIGKKENLDTKVSLSNNEKINFYNDKALFHMREVRDIITTFINIRNVSIIIAILSIIFIKLFIKNPMYALYKSLLPIFVIYVSIIIFIGAFSLISFDTFFIKLHETFFNNDLWLFDPRSEYIISLLPASLFFDILKRIILMMGGFILSLLFLYLYLSKTQLRQVTK